jgi:hypothetical protein
MRNTGERTGRKLRSDSKLGGLPSAQRALVEKWLFDKGMTYQGAADACLKMFGLEVSKSSVARYAERVLTQKVRKAKPEADEDGNAIVPEELGEWAQQMCCANLAGSGGAKLPRTEEAYRQTLDWLGHWALEELSWPEPEDADVKTALRVVWLLMDARREVNDEARMRLAWDKFELKAAKACLKEFKVQNPKLGRQEEGNRRPGGKERSKSFPWTMPVRGRRGRSERAIIG